MGEMTVAEQQVLRERLFRRQWLPRTISTVEYERVRNLPLTLLSEMYADTWRFGPSGRQYLGRMDQLQQLVANLYDVAVVNEELSLNFQRRFYKAFYPLHWHQHTMTGLGMRYERLRNVLPPAPKAAFARHPSWRNSRLIATLQHDPHFPKHYHADWYLRQVPVLTQGAHNIIDMAVKSRTASLILATQDEFWRYVNEAIAVTF